MTTMVTRDDVEDELYKLVGIQKAPHLRRVMKVIDAYAITMSHKLGPVEWQQPDVLKYLKPGETSSDGTKRRCRLCGTVKALTVKNFAPNAKDKRYKRRYSCTECSPNSRLKSLFFCRDCEERLPIDRFPAAKKRNPRLQLKCLVCEPK
jgi:hypothetical protein